MMWRLALVCAAVAVAAMLYAGHVKTKLDAATDRLDRATREIKTHERIRDADVGISDPDDDTIWLCKRAGRANCGP